MNINIRSLTLSELEKIICECLLDKEDTLILNMLARHKTILEISMQVGVSESTIKRHIKDIKNKINRM